MEMEDYNSLIDGIGRDKQIDYLSRIISMSSNEDEKEINISLFGEDDEIEDIYLDNNPLSLTLSKPDKRHIPQNDGTIKITQPKHIVASVNAILRDLHSGKETTDGPPDPLTRWKGLRRSNPQQVQEVERVLGRMPTGSLNDIPLERAIQYACKDSDATLRLALLFMERNLYEH